MKNWIENHIIGIVITVCLITSIVYTGISYNKQLDAWNNGYCTCGGQWELVDVQTRTYHHHNKNGTNTNRHKTTYYWKCDNCGIMLKTSYNFKKAN